ncbi:MAG: DUF3327 domain-containing protein, partial [Acidipropionibacterium acidipropionici]|nr:DUF3327 domain-containing protein [Acidipropionibacterium acidipropionici]
ELRSLARGVSPERLAPRWPVIGEPGLDGVPVTFVARAPAGLEVLLHLNGITDRTRTCFEWALMPVLARNGGQEIHAAAYLLPEGLAASYRLVTMPEIPRDAGRTRQGWRAVHEAGRADPLAARTMATPLGGDASLLTLPGASIHPAWEPGSPVLRPEAVRTDLEGAQIWDHGRHDRLVILFDTEQWEGVGLPGALRRLAGTPPLILAVASGSLEHRARFLPDPRRVESVVRPALRTVSRRWGTVPRERIMATGQSYGGLAAVGLVTCGAAPAGRALAQSASLHHVPGHRHPGEVTGPGSLVSSLGRGPSPGTIDLVCGTEEAGLLGVARDSAPLLERAGHRVTVRSVVGGHDYAWWCHELLFSLDRWR